MKKITFLFFVTVITIGSFTVNAQKAGFKMGVNFANMAIKPAEAENEIDGKKALISPRLGFIFEAPIYEGVFFQTGINTSVKGYRFNSVRMMKVDEIDGEAIKEPFDSKEFLMLWYIDLPLQFGYKAEMGDGFLYGMTGPSFNFGVYTTNLYKANGEWDNDHMSIGTTNEDDFKSFDLNWNLEFGYQYNRIQFGLFYSLGLSNIMNIPEEFKEFFDDVSMKNNVFGANIAILFGDVDGRGRGRGRGFRR